MRICDDLRQSVLQAAIQGKLTKQLPEDGNADELLKQIATEKNQLIKEGKIKKEKRLPEISLDEIPFEIPENWVFARLGDYLFIKSGDSLTSKDFKNGNIPVYGGNGITGYHNQSNVSKGTILIGRVGFYCGSVHVTVSNAWATDNALIVTYLSCFTKDYLVLMLKALDLGHNTNQTAQPVVTGKIIKPKIIPIPPLAEQQRIVAKVEELMARIDDLEKTETELEKLKATFPGDMKAALLQAAMQGKLTEQLPEDGDAADLINQIAKEKNQLIKEGKIKKEKPLPEITSDEVPFDIPENWKWVRFGDISTYGYTTKKINVKDVDGSQWLLDLEDIEKGGRLILKKKVCDAAAKGDRTVFSSGNILYSKLRPYLQKVLIADEDGVCTPELVPFNAFGGINPRYIVFFLLAPHVDKIVNKESYGVKMPRVNTKTMTELCFPLPPLAEQKRIVEKLDKLLPLCDGLVEE